MDTEGTIESISHLEEALRDGSLMEHRWTNVELKEAWSQDCGHRISALANRVATTASYLVVGVSDGGSLLDKQESWARQVEQTISQHLNSYLDPVQAVRIVVCREIGTSWVVVLTAANPGSVVFWNQQAYKGIGTTTARMRPDEVMELAVRLPGRKDYSAQPWAGPVDGSLVAEYANRVAVHRSEASLLAALPGGPEAVLVAARLHGRSVCRLLFGPTRFRVVKYDAAGEPVENESREGLLRLVSPRFEQEVQAWTREELALTENPYSERALKESLANAVAHAAFFDNDGEIVVELHPDRLAISNLCLPESAFFANKWFSRSHKTVNALLMETLRWGGFVDELGRGKSLIFEESILSGKRPPQVFVEKAGRFDRWRLCLYGGVTDPLQLRLRNRLATIYRDRPRALIAHALVLWADQPVANIRKYIDGESLPLFAQVLGDLNGPIFYYKEADRIVLRRWAATLLEEGKDSKRLTIPEEEDLLNFAYGLQTEYHHGVITPAELRKFASMGDTPSEKSMSSEILRRWVKAGIVDRVRRGEYRFRPRDLETPNLESVLSPTAENSSVDEIPRSRY